MSDPEKTVFISYRREPSQYLARAIYEHLTAHGYDVFFDIASIDSGDFTRIILGQIEARAHFIVLLSVGALERCVEPGDWLRREIEFAIEKQRNIVPIMVDKFDFSDAEKYLVGRLVELKKFNGLPVTNFFFDAAMEHLKTRYLKKPFYGDIVEPLPADKVIAEQRLEEATADPAPTEKQLSAEEYVEKATAKWKRGEFDEAIADCNEALRLNPDFAPAYMRRGTVYSEKGNLDGAITDLDEAIRLNPQYANAYNNRGIARKDKGDLEGAIADYNEAIRLNPQDVDAYINRGDAHEAKGDLDSAVADYSAAIRLNPQYVDAYVNRGIARQAKGDLEGAIADYNEAIRLNPQDADAYINRGIAHEAKGDLEGAIADYQKYLDLGGGIRDGDHAQVEQWIVKLKKQLGQ